MPDLSFAVEKVEPVKYSASPMLNFSLAVSEAAGEAIEAVLLRCQLRIEPTRRQYEEKEEEKLFDLFGEPARWGQTLRPMLWTHASVVVSPFAGKTTVELPVACTYDFNVAAAKFFHALEDGEVPLRLLFSGTIFQQGDNGAMRIAQIAWEKETVYRLPVSTWKQMMDVYYPNSVWVNLHKDAFDLLQQYKSRNGLPTLEMAIEKLMEEDGVKP